MTRGAGKIRRKSSNDKGLRRVFSDD